MKRNGHLGIILSAVAVALELLPWGAVCVFAGVPGSDESYVRVSYSYFDPLPFGYANFAPLITAVASVVILVMWMLGIVFEARKGYFRAVLAISLFAFLTSLAPLLLGFRYCSIVGALISAVRFASLIPALRFSEVRSGSASDSVGMLGVSE